MKNIVVVGSLNLDVVSEIEKLPHQGATISVKNQSQNLGGKGANQAVAAARQGGQVSFIGAVGADEAGERFKTVLREEGIDVSGIVTKKVPTGSASILLEEDGHNTIMVYGGANAELTADDIVKAENLIANADVVIAQFEVPQVAVAKAFYFAKKYGATTILNPAPIIDQDAILPEVISATDIIVPNETEAAALVGETPSTKLADLQVVREAMNQLTIQKTVITLGGEGVFYHLDGTDQVAPIFKVTPVDTTAAGDTFIGSLTVELDKDLGNAAEAIRYASKASSIAIQHFGALQSIPNRREVLKDL